MWFIYLLPCTYIALTSLHFLWGSLLLHVCIGIKFEYFLRGVIHFDWASELFSEPLSKYVLEFLLELLLEFPLANPSEYLFKIHDRNPSGIPMRIPSRIPSGIPPRSCFKNAFCIPSKKILLKFPPQFLLKFCPGIVSRIPSLLIGGGGRLAPQPPSGSIRSGWAGAQRRDPGRSGRMGPAGMPERFLPSGRGCACSSELLSLTWGILTELAYK